MESIYESPSAKQTPYKDLVTLIATVFVSPKDFAGMPTQEEIKARQRLTDNPIAVVDEFGSMHFKDPRTGKIYGKGGVRYDEFGVMKLLLG